MSFAPGVRLRRQLCGSVGGETMQDSQAVIPPHTIFSMLPGVSKRFGRVGSKSTALRILMTDSPCTPVNACGWAKLEFVQLADSARCIAQDRCATKANVDIPQCLVKRHNQVHLVQSVRRS